ncbi:hypothetical protein Nmel_007305 [Mimus melanotis]
MSGRHRSGSGYYCTKCCENTVLQDHCCLEEHYKTTSIRPEKANGYGERRRLWYKGRKKSSRVLQRYSVYRNMTAKGNLLAGSYIETSSLALGPQTSPLATNP